MACAATMNHKRFVVVAVMVAGAIAAPRRGRSMGCGCGRKSHAKASSGEDGRRDVDAYRWMRSEIDTENARVHARA